MRIGILAASMLLALSLAACSRSQPAKDQNGEHPTPAEAVGKMLYKANKKVEKAAAAAGRQIKKSAAEAHKGYKEAQQQDREKAKAKEKQ
jgi:hypothetical protein